MTTYNRYYMLSPQVALVLQLVHASAWSPPKAAPIEGKSARSAGELEEYEDVQGDTKLEDCGCVEVEMRNGEMGVKYVKDGEVGCTPVVRRRKKIARSEESESSGNLNVNYKRSEMGAVTQLYCLEN